MDVLRATAVSAAAAVRRGDGEGACKGIDAAASTACQVLAELSAHADVAEAYSLTEAGAIEVLTAVLRSAATALAFTQVQVDVMSQYKHCSANENGTATICAAVHAAHAVANVTVTDAACDRFFAAGGVSQLVALLSLSMQELGRVQGQELGQCDGLAVLCLSLSIRAAEAVCTLSTRARGAAALHAAGAIPALLAALGVARAHRSLTLAEAACWALRGFVPDASHLQALVAAGGSKVLATDFEMFCDGSADTAGVPPAIASSAEAETEARITQHVLALLLALRLSDIHEELPSCTA